MSRNTLRTDIANSRSTSGQAMVELVVGLIAILTITVGMLQLVSLMLAYNRVRTEARHNAGQAALLQAPPVSSPQFLKDWKPGPDGAVYSADDQPVLSGGESTFADIIVDQASDTDEGWTAIGTSPSDRLTPLRAGAATAYQLGLVSGQDRESVPMMSAVQTLLYGAASVDVKSEVFMAWCDGMY